MKSVLFQSGMRILQNVLDYFQLSKDEAISERTTDLLDDGTLKNSHQSLGSLETREFKIVTGTNHVPPSYKIRVTEGIGYDVNGERILIPKETTPTTYNVSNPTHTTDRGDGVFVSTPRSTGCNDITVSVGNIYYIWVKYLKTCDDSIYTIHKGTRNKIFYQWDDGYEIILVVNSSTAPDSESILLATVDLTSITSPNSVNYDIVTSYTNRYYSRVNLDRVKIHTATVTGTITDQTTAYTYDTDYFLDDHIKAIGTGSILPSNPHAIALNDISLNNIQTNAEIITSVHNKLFHGNGIIDDTLTALGNSVSGLVFFVNPLTSSQYVNFSTSANQNVIVHNTDMLNEDFYLSGLNHFYSNTPSYIIGTANATFNSLVSSTFIVTADNATATIVTFISADFASPTAATASEVCIKINTTVGWSIATVYATTKIKIASIANLDSRIVIGNGTSNSILGFMANTTYYGTRDYVALTLTDSTTNYVYIQSDGTISSNNTGTLTTEQILLYKVVASGTLTVTDRRLFGTDKAIKTKVSGTRIETGTYTSGTIAYGAHTGDVITFAKPYTSAPKVFLTCKGNGGNSISGEYFFVGTFAIGLTNLYIYVQNNYNGAPNSVVVDWMAIGV